MASIAVASSWVRVAEFARPCALRKVSAVLPQESHHEIEGRVGHFDEGFDPAVGLIVAAQIFDLPGQSDAYGLEHALGEEFGLRGGIEEPEQITGVVENVGCSTSVWSPIA